MAGVNSCHFIGRLGREVELKYTKSGKAVCNFSIAVQERKDSPTTWVNIIGWDKLAEIMCEYLNKGSLVYIEGRLQVRDWEDDKGNKRQTTEIVASKMTMLGNQAEDRPKDRPSKPDNQGDDIEDDDIPF